MKLPNKKKKHTETLKYIKQVYAIFCCCCCCSFIYSIVFYATRISCLFVCIFNLFILNAFFVLSIFNVAWHCPFGCVCVCVRKSDNAFYCCWLFVYLDHTQTAIMCPRAFWAYFNMNIVYPQCEISRMHLITKTHLANKTVLYRTALINLCRF